MADDSNCHDKNPSPSSLLLFGSTSGSSNSGTSTKSSILHHASTSRLDSISDQNNLNAGIYNEQVLAILFRCLNWDPQTLCSTACASRRHRAVAERILFYELCLSRAPRLVASILSTRLDVFPRGVGGSSPRVPGGWSALAKLLLYCDGCTSTIVSSLSQPVPGHFTPFTRFSKTSGKSFLIRRCCDDLLYVSDPCEHGTPLGEDHDLGVFRGVFGAFVRSRTRACLLGRNTDLEEHVRCPYCGKRVWSMATAGMVPRSASRRLGSLEDGLDYFVCVNGHLHGNCWLTRLSSNSDDNDGDNDDDGGNNSGFDGDETAEP